MFQVAGLLISILEKLFFCCAYFLNRNLLLAKSLVSKVFSIGTDRAANVWYMKLEKRLHAVAAVKYPGCAGSVGIFLPWSSPSCLKEISVPSAKY